MNSWSLSGIRFTIIIIYAFAGYFFILPSHRVWTTKGLSNFGGQLAPPRKVHVARLLTSTLAPCDNAIVLVFKSSTARGSSCQQDARRIRVY